MDDTRAASALDVESRDADRVSGKEDSYARGVRRDGHIRCG